MTICCAAIRDGHASLTTDSFGSGPKAGRTHGHKFLNIDHDGLLIAYAGSYRVAQMAEDVILATDPFRNGIDYWKVKKLSNAIIKEALKFPVGDAEENETIDLGTEFLLVSKEKIFIIDSAFAVHEFEDYASIGFSDEGNLALDIYYDNKRLKLSSVTSLSATKVCKFYRSACAEPLYTRTL